MPGTITKRGNRARAFLVGGGRKVSLEYLNRFVPAEYQTGSIVYKSNLTRAAAKEKYPEWYEKRIVQKQKRGSWTCKRDLYDWWKRKIEVGGEDVGRGRGGKDDFGIGFRRLERGLDRRVVRRNMERRDGRR